MGKRGKIEKEREETVSHSPAFAVTVNGLSTTCRTEFSLYRVPSLVPNMGIPANTVLVGYKQHIDLTPPVFVSWWYADTCTRKAHLIRTHSANSMEAAMLLRQASPPEQQCPALSHDGERKDALL